MPELRTCVLSCAAILFALPHRTRQSVPARWEGHGGNLLHRQLPFPGQVFTPPYAVAHIQLRGADTRLMHMIGDTTLDRVHIGMTVEPAWVADAELAPTMQSIRYFRPSSDEASHA